MKILKNCIYLFTLIILTSSCGTIFGGARYNAHVEVKGHPDASIYYNGINVGVGQTKFLHKRNQANQLEIIIKKDGCKDYTRNYDSKVPRLVPILGTASEIAQIIYSLLASGTIGIPGGTIIDMLTGGYYKPNVSNPEITKINYDNFKYTIEYDCQK